MALQILGGKFKGLVLDVPSFFKHRPTSVLLRRKFYDAHQKWMQPVSGNAIFFDLCAGTGLMGLEALSRGIKQIYFIEHHLKSLKYLQSRFGSNPLALSREQCYFSSKSVQHFLTPDLLPMQLALLPPQSNLLFFADPPYQDLECYRFFLAWIKHSYELTYQPTGERSVLCAWEYPAPLGRELCLEQPQLEQQHRSLEASGKLIKVVTWKA